MVITIAFFGRGTVFGSFILLKGAIPDPMTSKSSVFPVESSVSEQLRGRDFPGKDRPVVLPSVEKGQVSNTRAIPADTMNHSNILHRKTSPSTVSAAVVDPSGNVSSCAMPISSRNERLPKLAETSAQLLEVRKAIKTLGLARKALRRMHKDHVYHMQSSDYKGEPFKKKITRQIKVVDGCRSNLFKLEHPEIAVVSELPAELTKNEAKLILNRYNEQHGKSMPGSAIDVAQLTKKRAQPPSTIVAPVKPDPDTTNRTNTAGTESQGRAKKYQKNKTVAEKRTGRAENFKKTHPEISNVPSKLSLNAKKRLLAAVAAAQDAGNNAPPRRVNQWIVNRVRGGFNVVPMDLLKIGSTVNDPITID